MAPSALTNKETASRLYHLDSLRGIAALAVLFHHTLICFQETDSIRFQREILGFSSVTLFFLLSGFVLSRSLAKVSRLTKKVIANYCVKRFFRLYPAVIASLIFASAATTFSEIPKNWIPQPERPYGAIDRARAANHLSNFVNMLDMTDLNTNPPLWTIRVELMCSMLLPFLILIGRTLALELILAVLLALIRWRCQFLGLDYSASMYMLGYLFAFFMGHLIQSKSNYLNRISTRATKLLLGFSALLFVFSLRSGTNGVTHTLVLAALLAVLVPCNWPWLKSFLESTPLRFLGHISYSFYLIHCPILLFSYKLVPERLWSGSPFLIVPVVFLIAVSITIPLATILEYFVEQPFNNLGHHLATYWFSEGMNCYRLVLPGKAAKCES